MIKVSSQGSGYTIHLVEGVAIKCPTLTKTEVAYTETQLLPLECNLEVGVYEIGGDNMINRKKGPALEQSFLNYYQTGVK